MIFQVLYEQEILQSKAWNNSKGGQHLDLLQYKKYLRLGNSSTLDNSKNCSLFCCSHKKTDDVWIRKNSLNWQCKCIDTYDPIKVYHRWFKKTLLIAWRTFMRRFQTSQHLFYWNGKFGFTTVTSKRAQIFNGYCHQLKLISNENVR